MSICVNHPEKTSADYNVGSKSDIVDRKGYRMIRSIDIENFRCFEKLTLGDLTRVNVVTGSNASGKSALLEAIYLGANATAPAFQTVATFRGSVASIPLNPGPLAVSLALTTPQSLSTYFDSL